MRQFLVVVVLLLSATVRGQQVTGSWYGLAEPSAKGTNTNNYLTELIITQRGTEVQGIFGYYFRSGYQSYYIRGKYNPKTRRLTINNIPITYFKSRDIDGIDCPMNFEGTLFTSRLQSRLTGAFISHEKYKYTCPQLNFNFTLDVSEKNQDSLIRSGGTVKKYWKPRAEELVVNTGDVAASMVRPVITDEKKGSDSARPVVIDTARKRDLEKLVTSFAQRKNILSSEISIESDSVRISFYDNGDIDGDSISVFINKLPVLTHQPLSEKALNLYLAMDSLHPNTEITMYAENLGIYPPNTALMVITDGDKRHEVYLSSSLTQNSSVILKRKKR